MDFSGSFMELEIVGNKLWRIIALFVIIFFSFVLGKIAKHLLQKSTTRLEGLQREVLAATFSASSRGVVFLCIAFGISFSGHSHAGGNGQQNNQADKQNFFHFHSSLSMM